MNNEEEDPLAFFRGCLVATIYCTAFWALVGILLVFTGW